MDKNKTKGQSPPLLLAHAITQHQFALAEPWVSASPHLPLALQGHPLVLEHIGAGRWAMPVPACLLAVWAGTAAVQVSQTHPLEPRTGALMSTSRLTFTVTNFCILSHLLALFFLKLHLLWVMIPPAVARP